MPTVVKQNRFPEIIRSLDPQVSTAIRRAAEMVAEEAKNRVPVRSGRLRDAIHVEAEQGGWNVVAGDTAAFYGHIVEFGSVNTPARPFLVPATEAKRAAIEDMVSDALKRL